MFSSGAGATFHGGTAQLKDNPSDQAIAEAAARASMVVFVPSWVERFSMDVGAADLSTGFANSACALAFAQQEAAAYGGDPDRTVVHGFSAGATAAAWLALGHGAEATPGCVADEPASAPVGAVLGDSEYFLHTRIFDKGFETEPEAMLVHVAAVTDPTTWADERAERFRIWSAASGTESRFFDDPWDDDGWLAQRDPDRSIRGDLDELGQLDDGEISFIDQGQLLSTRLQESGADATVDEYPGDHTVLDKVPEIVDYLLDAAGAA